MATATNSTTLYSRNSARYTLTAYFNENSTSTANNTSNITVTATMSSSTSAFYETNAGTLAIYWHDNKDNTDVLKSSATLISCGFPPDYSSQSVTSTFDAPHNSDGTLSGYAYAVWTLTKNTGGYVPNSGNVATANTILTTIPRSATLTLSTTSVTVGDAFWASNSPFVSGFTYTLTASNSNATKTFYTKQSISDTYINTTSSNFYDFLSATQSSVDVTFTLTTYNGNSVIGSNNKTLRVNANLNDVPTVSINSVDIGKTVFDTTKTTLDLTGSNKTIINNWNTVSSTWSATTSFNTTIASVKIRGQEVSSSPVTLNDISNGITIVATDSRGNAKSLLETDLTFIPYEYPSIVPTLKRNTATDGHASLTFTGMFYNINFGVETNDLTLEWYVREKGDTTYTQGITPLTYTINSDNRSYVNAGTISLVNPLDQVDGLFDYTKAYEFKFVANDLITSYTISDVILTKGIPNFVVFKDAVFANGNRIDNNSNILNTIFPVGKTEIFYDNNDHSNWLGFSWVRVTGAYLYAGSGAIQNAGSNTTSSTAITIDQMPSHTHTQNPHTHAQNRYTFMNDPNNYDFLMGTGNRAYAGADTATYYTDNATATNNYTGGSQGHTHTAEPYRIEVAIWRRVA